jgi:hypothetical protein
MSSTVPTTPRTTRGVTVGRILIVLGGALAAVSSWLNWGSENEALRAPARSAYTIPAKFIIDIDVKVPGPVLNLGIVVLILGLLVIGMAFTPGWKVAGLLLGLAVGVVAVLYAYQVREVIHEANLGRSFRDLISIGPYIAGVGGALAVIGSVIAFIPAGFWASLTSEETEEEDTEKPADQPGAP